MAAPAPAFSVPPRRMSMSPPPVWTTVPSTTTPALRMTEVTRPVPPTAKFSAVLAIRPRLLSGYPAEFRAQLSCTPASPPARTIRLPPPRAPMPMKPSSRGALKLT
ncbi:hypothetical protein D3C80_1530010 [compost metagenome]